jgi:quinoprotein dehydrogenase-associated probable ABC transporter substrate-binding protein
MSPRKGREAQFPRNTKGRALRPLARTAMVAAMLSWLAVPVPAGPPELIERGSVRVCADGNNLPYSNEAGEGFENRIAEMMAEDLGVELRYVYAPQIMGFVRNTLELRVCDVIIGVAAGYELVQNTNAYFRSTYAMVMPEDSDLEVANLTDAALHGRRIGVVTDTPPVVPLRQAGARVKNYHLMVDTRAINPVRDAVEDVAEGETEMAVLWGPIAGWFAQQHDPPLKVVPLAVPDPSGARLDFRITMGIRRNEPLWKDWINDFIERRQDEINQILVEYGVPLLDARGAPLVVAEGAAE